MISLNDFEAAGVSFPDVPREDVDSLIDTIADKGVLHLAILQQPYLNLITDGTKTIESRFNTKRSAPFNRISSGDLVLLKEPGKPITNYFFAASVALFDLNNVPLEYVRENYAEGIQAQDEGVFWADRASSRYVTLVEVGERGSVSPLPVVKKDQRGWVTFRRKFDNESDWNATAMDDFLL